MKQILFLIIAVLTIIGCSKDLDVKTDEDILKNYKVGFSNDSIYSLKAYNDKFILYKNKMEVWSVKVNAPEPMNISSEYGETETKIFNVGAVYFADLNPIIRWELKQYSYFDFYEISGRLSKREKVTCYSCTLSKSDLMAISDNYILVYDKKGNLIKQIPCSAYNKIFFYDHTLFYNDYSYVTYNTGVISIADVNHGEINRFRAELLVQESFPSETYTPKGSIKEVNIINTNIDLKISYTLFDGSKGELQYTIDGMTGSIHKKTVF